MATHGSVSSAHSLSAQAFSANCEATDVPKCTFPKCTGAARLQFGGATSGCPESSCIGGVPSHSSACRDRSPACHGTPASLPFEMNATRPGSSETGQTAMENTRAAGGGVG